MVCTKAAVVKFVLVVFNVIFLAFGLALLALGIYAKIESNTADDYLRIIDRSDSTFANFGSIGIVCGVFCLLLGFTGFIGICKNHRKCLIFFVALVSLILILDLAAGGLAYGFHNKIENTIRDGMYSTIDQYDGTNDIAKSWDNIQSQQQCCGVINATDWANSNATFNSTVGVPESCVCTTVAGCGSIQFDSIFPKGCYSDVDHRVLSNWKAWGGAAIAFAVFMIIGIIFGIIAIRQANEGYRLA